MSDLVTRRAHLLPNHRNVLERAIDPTVLDARGYQSLSRGGDGGASEALSRLKSCGIPRWARDDPSRLPGLLIPLYGPSGGHVSWVFRSDNPPTINGRTRKYAAPAGRVSVLDVHPSSRNAVGDPTVPLFITEGVKKADALTSRGCCTVALQGVFNWRSSLGVLGAWEEVALKGRVVYVVFDSDAGENPNVANAMDRLGRWLGSRGVKSVRYVVTPAGQDGNKNTSSKTGVDDWLAAGGVLPDLLALASSEPPKPVASDRFSDSRVAEMVASQCLVDRHVWAFGGGWHQWLGTHWRRCDERVAIESVRRWLTDRYTECKDLVKRGKVDQRELSAWLGLQAARRINAVTRLASGMDEVLVDMDDFDKHPHLLNTPSMVVDLSSGEYLGHEPSLYMTKITGANYDPTVDSHPDWDKVLEAIPDECHSWLQVKLGQAITGYTNPDDQLTILYGGGANGKSTLMYAIQRALGNGYFQTLGDRTLHANTGDHPTELMSLKGARIAVLEETSETRRLNTQRLKRIVGTEQITARLIRQNEVTFDTTHTIFLNTNYRPLVDEMDNGTWRRLVLVPFPYTFRHSPDEVASSGDRLGDPNLRFRVKNGDDPRLNETVLTWLVDGAYLWFASGRMSPPTPEVVRKETWEWRRDSDISLSYIEDRLVFDDKFYVMTTDLLDDFNVYVSRLRHRPWSERLLKSRLIEHDRMVNRTEYLQVRRGDSRTAGCAISRPTADQWSVKPPVPQRFRALFGVRFNDDVIPRSDHRTTQSEERKSYDN